MKVLKIKSSIGTVDGMSKGSEKAPDIIQKKVETEFWLNEQGTHPYFSFEDCKIEGDVNQAIYDKAKSLVSNPAVFLAGDHSCSYGTMKAFLEEHKDVNPGVIVFDAHPDLMGDVDGVNHETYLRRLIEEGILKKENVVLVGISNWDIDEYDYLKKKNIKCFTMKEIAFEGKEETCNLVMAGAKDFGVLYVSIDIDCVNSGEAPGTGYPEPGGLTARELLYFLHRLKNLKNWKATDIVEVNPDKDIDGRTSKLAAKILFEVS